MYCNDRLMVYEAFIPPEEDPDALIADFVATHPGYMEYRTPIIVVHKLFAEWFRPPICKLFFEGFGRIRYFDVKFDGEFFNASVEYLDYRTFLTTLKTLCCCSVRKGDSHELNDYVVTLDAVSNYED